MIVSGVFALPFDDSAGFTAPPAFGPFRVLHQIGSGALGPVFRTFEPQRETLVAVKAFRLDVVPEVTSQLADALRRVAATPIEHPAVVPVVDAGMEGTTTFLATEYVAAETLDVKLRQMAPARIEIALPMLRQLAGAIEAAWAVGVGHGALHPRDIFVLSGAVPVRIAGFGVIPALESLRIPAPIRRPYTAPERAEGGVWDIRADVYSLAVIAHELLTGRRPAGAGEQAGELAAGTSADLRVAIRQALSGGLVPDPGLRFATPTAFVDALTTGVEVDPAGALGQTPSTATIAPLVPDEPVPAPVEPVAEVPEATSFRSTELRRSSFPVLAVPDFAAWNDSAPSHGRGLLALIVAVAVVAGTGLGYWLRGPAAADAPVSQEPPSTPLDGPDGTEGPAGAPATAGAAAAASAPAATPPAPAADVRRGRLLVRSVPAGALVSINGRARGTTPATIRDLPFGTYNIAVSRPGYQRRAQRVTVSRAVPARDITVELVSTAPLAPAASTGAVYVETRPAGATVSIDGRPVGTAPMRVPELAPGPHRIRVDMAGHKSVTTTAVVRAGQQTLVRLSLEIQ
jgi:hypothetical protein